MKKIIFVMTMLIAAISLTSVQLTTFAENNYSNYLNASSQTEWTLSNNDNGEASVENGAITIQTTSDTATSTPIGGYISTEQAMPAYVAEYDFNFNYTNEPEDEKGYLACQIFDGAYRALISVYKSSISVQSDSGNVSAQFAVTSGEWYRMAVVVKNGNMSVYIKNATDETYTQTLFTDITMKANTATPGKFFVYMQNATNAVASVKDVNIDSWNDAFDNSCEYETKESYTADFSDISDWNISSEDNIKVDNGILNIKANGLTTAQTITKSISDYENTVVDIRYMINNQTAAAGRMFVRFEDVGSRAFFQMRPSKMYYCTKNSTASASYNISTSTNTWYTMRIIVDSKNSKYTVLRKTDDTAFTVLIKDTDMQTQTTTAKKLCIGVENDTTLDVSIQSISVDCRNIYIYKPVCETVFTEDMTSIDNFDSTWTISGTDGISDGTDGITLTSDGSTYKPSMQKLISYDLPLEVEFDCVFNKIENDTTAFLGVQFWNGIDSRGFIQIYPDKIKILSNSGNTDYTEYTNAINEKYTYKIRVDSTKMDIYRKGSDDNEFVPIALDVTMQTGHSVSSPRLKLYLEKTGVEITVSNLQIASAKEYYISSVNTDEGIKANYVCQKDDSDGGKIYVAVYDKDGRLKKTELFDASVKYGKNEQIISDTIVENNESVKFFIWNGMTPLATNTEKNTVCIVYNVLYETE
ncbi:MAG: hypothetical protein PUB42_01100 [Firmicutes bacterium]|nr:hypothetical protein [Bacillota bacterium]